MLQDTRHQLKQQKGAIFVLTALLIPLLIAFLGAVVDFGNVYAHKARLQNAADAAVLAGAHQYAVNEETIDNHPRADNEAGDYVDRDMPLDSDSYAPQYDATEGDSCVYYRVRLTEKVPTFFIKYFYIDDVAVHVSSIASISYESTGGGNTEALFIFEKNFFPVNSIDNPDNFNIEGQITTTFDGKVYYTDGVGDTNNDPNHKPSYFKYSNQTDKLDYFFTEAARDKGMSVNQAINAGLTTQASYHAYDFSTFGKTIRSMPSKLATDQNAKSNYISEQTADGSVLKFTTEKTPNANITINHKLTGSSDKPVYILIDGQYNQWTGQTYYPDVVNISVDADTSRPLIICSMGPTKIHMNMNHHTFRGIIYAPYINDEGVLINANNGTFSGTIIANSINLQGGRGTYKYEDFGIDIGGGSGTSGGKKGISKNSKVALADDSVFND